MTEARRQVVTGAGRVERLSHLALSRILLWVSLVPLLLLLHPYGGLVQDARIYIGRGLADHDPAGVGRDIVFADDAQTGFSLVRVPIRLMLDVMSPGGVSMLMALAGTLLWLAGAVALMRRLAPGMAGWAAVVAILALRSRYGAFGAFSYAEAIATPRVFAEAAVLGGLAMLLDGRRWAGLAFLALAFALHPLMTLPGLGVAALLLIHDDRRWAPAIAGLALAALGAAALRLPVAGRLFDAMDPAWWSILRHRCDYLFPTRWPAEAFAHATGQAAAALVAGGLMASRGRVLLWGAVAVAAGGVALSLAFGDLLPGLLVTQLQPWRATWLLAVLGNAGVVLAAVGLWRRAAVDRVVLGLLVVALCAEPCPMLAILSGVGAVGLMAAARFGPPFAISRNLLRAVAVVAAVMAALAVATDVASLWGLWASASRQGGEMSWPLVVAAGPQSIPLVIGAVALALSPPWAAARGAPGETSTAAGLSRFGAPWVGLAVVSAACAAAILLWDGRTAESRAIDGGSGAAELREAVGPAPGDVLWIDESDQNWFLLGRPSFFNALQGAPILFSRAMALDWADRARTALGLGLARPWDVAPWSATEPTSTDLTLSPDAVARFCADPRHPAAVVAPGAQRGAAPPGVAATLWRPQFPLHRLTTDGEGLRWRRIDVFTVVRCRAGGGDAPTSSW